MCGEPPTDRELADKILAAIKKEYGFIPLVNQVLSERPDIFVPAANFGKAALEGKEQKMERKTAYLCAISAATALGAEHCVRAQGTHAKAAGVTKAEMMEAMFIGSYMAMTRSQSYAFRVLQDLYKEE